MKNNKTNHAVNKQEDEDVETYILHQESAVDKIKHHKPQQSADSYKIEAKQTTPGNSKKNHNR